jgi:hypothetical protein
MDSDGWIATTTTDNRRRIAILTRTRYPMRVVAIKKA